MTMPSQQQRDLIERTLDNLRFLERHQDEVGVWEVTQIVNSFLCVIAHPKEQLFNSREVRWLSLGDAVVVASGMPRMPSSSGYDTEEPRTFGRLITLLRNGVAHGNIELLNEAELIARRPETKRSSNVARDDVAGMEIWNELNGSRTWGTVLTLGEMRQCLESIAVLARNPTLGTDSAGRKLGGRKEDSPEGRELLAGRPLSRRAEG